MTVTVPDEFCRLLDDDMQTDVGLRTHLAAHFYSLGKVSVGKAAEMAGMERRFFEQWLHEHGVDMPWQESDLEHEISYAKQLSYKTGK